MKLGSAPLDRQRRWSSMAKVMLAVARLPFVGMPKSRHVQRLSALRSAQGPVDLDLLRAVARRFGRDAADKLEQVLAS